MAEEMALASRNSDVDGKLHWSLVDFKSLEPMVEILEFGAKKYTKEVNFTVDNILSLCRTVKIIQIKRLSQKDYVELVMTSNLNWQIQTIEGDRKLTRAVGTKIIQNEQKQTNETVNVLLPPNKKNRRNSLNMHDAYSEVTELLPISITPSNLQDALFVGQQNVYMLTIATKQDSLGEYYVVNATKDLDSLTMIFRELQEQSIISSNIYLQNNHLIDSGTDNWKKGLGYRQLGESLARHLFAWLSGEENDPESGKSHIGHIQCNAMFMAYMNRMRPDMDDRGKERIKPNPKLGTQEAYDRSQVTESNRQTLTTP